MGEYTYQVKRFNEIKAMFKEIGIDENLIELPEANRTEYIDRLERLVIPLITAIKGRQMILDEYSSLIEYDKMLLRRALALSFNRRP